MPRRGAAASSPLTARSRRDPRRRARSRPTAALRLHPHRPQRHRLRPRPGRAGRPGPARAGAAGRLLRRRRLVGRGILCGPADLAVRPRPVPASTPTATAALERLTPHASATANRVRQRAALHDGSVLCSCDLARQFERLASCCATGAVELLHARRRRRRARAPRRRPHAQRLVGQPRRLRPSCGRRRARLEGLPRGVSRAPGFLPDGRISVTVAAARRHRRRLGRAGARAAHALDDRRHRRASLRTSRELARSRASTASRCRTSCTARRAGRRCCTCTAAPSRSSGRSSSRGLSPVRTTSSARGLTVAAPNVRGSTGYGRDLPPPRRRREAARLGPGPRAPRWRWRRRRCRSPSWAAPTAAT